MPERALLDLYFEELGTRRTLSSQSTRRRSSTPASPGFADGHEEEEEAVTALVGGKSQWTALVCARSSIRSGQPLELGVGISRHHFSDPASGDSIGHPLNARAAG
jgi:hypothetical protein